MKKSLRSGTQEVEVFGLWKERQEEGETGIPHWGTSQRFLNGFLTDPMAIQALREGLSRHAPYLQPNQMTDHDVLHHVNMRMLADPDSVGIAQVERVTLSGEGKKPATAEAAGGGAPLIKPAAVKPWIKFQVIDDETEKPIPGVTLIIKKPDGWLKEYTTDGRGLVTLDPADDGTYEARGNRDGARLRQTLECLAVLPDAESKKDPMILPGPLRVLFVDEHKSKKEESILSLATSIGMTWQALSDFNWGTHIPEEINKHLVSDVGCTKKTADGYNYMFDDSDDPGIMYLPLDWSEGGLAVNNLHSIRVKVPSVGAAETGMLIIRVFDPFTVHLPDAPCRITLGGKVFKKNADADGFVTQEISGTPEECVVEWGAVEDAPGSYLYSRTIFLHMQGLEGDEEVRRRLHNLGYSYGETLSDNVKAFQADFGFPQTGQPADVKSTLRDWHDDQNQVQPRPEASAPHGGGSQPPDEKPKSAPDDLGADTTTGGFELR